MEVKEKSKKREIIKSVAIVFLAVLLVLTFFSNTIMNRSLPEVATQSIASGTINAKIRGTGTVTANESYEVLASQTRKVRSVCVQVGDIVSQGDLLFVLEDMESSELATAQEQLDNAQMQYQTQLLNFSKTYASEDRTLQVLREELAAATKERDENKVTDGDITSAKGELATGNNELTRIALMLEELNATLNGNEDYANAQAAVTKWTASMESAQQKIQEYTAQLSELGSSGTVDFDRKIQAAQTALDGAKRTLSSDWMAYKPTYQNLVADVQARYQDTAGIAEIFADIEDAQGQFVITADQQMYIDAYLTEYTAGGDTNPYAAAYTALKADYADVQEKSAALAQAQADKNSAVGDANTQRAAIQAKLNTANYDYSVAYQQLQQANYLLQQAESSLTACKEQIKSYESYQRQQKALVESLTENLNTLTAKKTAYDAAVQTITEKERAIEDTLTGKNIDKQLDDLTLESLRKQIEKAQEQVDRYTAESMDTEITANVSGLITSINASAGKETAAGVAMAVIDVVDRGYMLKIPVTTEQSRQVRVGDTANVTNYYWGNEVEAVLENITADPSNPGTGKLLVFRVTGDVDAGASLTLSIGQRSANYDAIIPKSALREDTNGYFVLVITVKSTPLSNRYIATRVDVQVLAEDDTSAAVSGLSAGDFVITTSSRPVEAGTQVRMVENG